VATVVILGHRLKLQEEEEQQQQLTGLEWKLAAGT
jgi:hypothetical protein